MMQDPEDVLQRLTEIEAMAEDILTDKQQMINLDRQRNETRKAVRVLLNDVKKGAKREKCAWICVGKLFLKMEKNTIKNLLETNQKTLDTEIDNLNKGLKAKVSKLRVMEEKPELRGFHLNPLSRHEIASVGGVLM